MSVEETRLEMLERRENGRNCVKREFGLEMMSREEAIGV